MTLAPPCPACARVEWLGDGVLITQDHARARARRLTVATRPTGERRWSCMACWHAVPSPSHLHELLEEIAAVALGERQDDLDATTEPSEADAGTGPANAGYRSDRDY